jgi:DNA-binding transcriptional regulator LsrR (DeoR family)
MNMDSDQKRLLYKLARAYYEDGETQKQIGNRFGLSRIKVSRMLRQAREQKVVQIMLFPGNHANTELEHRIEQKYGIHEVIAVTPEQYTPHEIRKSLGVIAADLLVRTIQGTETIAVTWGNSLLAVVDALPGGYLPDLKIVQSLGGLSRPDAHINGVELTRRMAEAFGTIPLLLPAPGVVKHKSVRDSLLTDPQISQILAAASKANIAIVGVGSPTTDSVVRTGQIFSNEDIQRQLTKGAVGDIGLRFFNACGEKVEDEINNRIIGLELDQIRRIPRVIAVAGGPEKAGVIRAALRGKLINVLVTDDRTAELLLRDHD